MFCKFCGSQIEDNAVICPFCNKQLDASVSNEPKAAAPVKKKLFEKTEKSEGGNPLNPKAKGYAAIASALIAFPAFLCLVLDYVGPPEWFQGVIRFFSPDYAGAQHGVITWSAYLLGLLMCLWMAVVLPAIKPKRPAVTVCICLAVISLYLLLLAYVNHNAGWYINYVLPICLMLTVSSAIVSILIAYKVIPASHIASAIGIQAALLCVGFEILFDINIRQAVNLRWSLIIAVALIGTIIVYEAVNYAVRINKK